MQSHDKAVAPARALPAVKSPQQLPLPNIPPAPVPLSATLIQTAKKYRYPIAAVLIITGLYLAGQGAIATGLLFSIALFLINQCIDSRMTRGDK